MTPEGALKKEIKAMLSERGAFWSMIPGGAYAKIGDPDMIVCYKGRYIAVEAKVDTVQSNWQKMREVEIRKAGGIYVLAHSIEDVQAVLDNVEKCTDSSIDAVS